MKRISILILVIALCTILVGCGDKEKNVINNDYNENVIQNQENTGYEGSNGVNNGGSNINESNIGNESGIIASGDLNEEVIPVDIKEEGDTMTVSMFGLYDIIYKFAGENVVQSYSKYSFYSELARYAFVEDYKNESSGEIIVTGLEVMIKNDNSEFENLTRTEIVNQYEELKAHYE